MSPANSGDQPVVEPNPQGDTPDVTLRALEQRIRQQEILAELGVTALQGAPFDELIAETARLTALGLDVEFCKVMEHVPAEGRLLIRAGVGWGPDVIGVASVGADLESPAGFALRTGKPVISNHLENEERFRTPELLQRHGIHRAMNVILQGDGKPFGVLEVDSRSESEFSEFDLAFLQGAANILGMAIERERHERHMKAALQRHQFLLKEMNHRVKNSLTMVAGMLRLQASDIGDPNLTQHLADASDRVSAVAKAHEQLSMGADIERMDLGQYIATICRDLNASVAPCEVSVDVARGIHVSTDRAISSAMIVNELVANAAKYAYRERSGGSIKVALVPWGDAGYAISVSDDGSGLPPEFDPRKAKGLGMRIIRAIAEQLKATLDFRPRTPGTEFTVKVPGGQ